MRALFIAVCSVTVLCFAGCPVYVDKTVQVPVEQQDGFSWATAFSTIQAGVDTAVNKRYGTWAVWVRGESEAIPGGNPYCDGVYNEVIVVDPSRDFYLFGGFSGTEEPYYTEEGGAELTAKERSWIKHPTYIDGSAIAGNDHILFISGNVHLCGFVIRNREATVGPLSFTPYNGSSIVSNTIFEDNTATVVGGAVTVYDGHVKLVNCLFRGNQAYIGGVIAVGEGTAQTINSTFVDNSAVYGILHAAYGTGIDVVNSIIWGNSCTLLFNGSPDITYSCVQGGYPGVGNINQEPLFVDVIPALSYGSPCIDAGAYMDAPDHDLLKNPRPIGYGVDMGAFEGIYTADLEGAIAINEVLGNNEITNQDEDGHYSPWLELHNTSLSSVNLQGWTLSHDATYWTFPNITLTPGEYRLVFLSGKNRTGTELHTNFLLSSQGGTILLQDDQNPPVSFMYFDYPADMPADVSYGLNETVHIDNKLMLPCRPLRPPTPEERNDTYFGHALAAWRCYNPSSVSGNLPYLTGRWPWRKGYKVTTKGEPEAQYITDNLHKFNIFYINTHGASIEGQYGWFHCSDRSMTNNEIESIVQDGHSYTLIHLNVCRSGLIGEAWREAFNAITFLGWDSDVYNNHCAMFDDYFYYDYIRVAKQTITAATANAYLRVEDLHPDIIAQYGFDPVPFPVITGNFDLRLDVPDSTYSTP